jgi:hypothetical protein
MSGHFHRIVNAPPESAVAAAPPTEPTSETALEVRSSENDAAVVELTDQLRKSDERGDDPESLQVELKQQLEAAVEKSTELHTKTIAAKNDLGGEG